MALSSNWTKLKTDKSVIKSKNQSSLKNKGAKSKGGVHKSTAANSYHSNNQHQDGATQTAKPRVQGRIKTVVDDISKQIKVRSVQRDLEKTLGSMPSEELQKILDQDTKMKGVSKSAQEIGKYIAIDCEFVGVGIEGGESALARVSIVNYFGHTVLDEYVKPKERVVDFRTWVSGIKPSDLADARKFEDVQQQVADIFKGRILVGHSIYHDLDALLLSHPKSMIRDTSRHVPYRQKYSNGKTPALKKLAKEVLNIEIQEGEHSSVEDARVTMLLYKFDKNGFDKLVKSKFHNK